MCGVCVCGGGVGGLVDVGDKIEKNEMGWACGAYG